MPAAGPDQPLEISPESMSRRVAMVSTCGDIDDLCSALEDQHHRVRPYTRPGLGAHDLAPVVGELAEQWLREPPDLVATYGLTAALGARAALRELPSIPVVHSFDRLAGMQAQYFGRHGTIDQDRLRLERAICHDVDHVLARSAAEADTLVRLGIARARTSVVPGGVDLELFTPDGPDRDLPDKIAPHRLVYVTRSGHFTAYAGIDTAILALQGLPDAELVVAGGAPADGPEGVAADPEARRLLELAGRAQVTDRVRLLGGLPHDEIPGLLRSADIVVSVPSYVPYGTVAVEAMGCGRAVVASAVSGHLDTVIEGMTGVLVPPREPKALARAIHDLLADPLLMEGFGVAARERAEIRHAWPRIAEELTAVYAQVTMPGFSSAAGVFVRQ